MPQTAGRIELAGPKAAIRIARDADGVPTITAQDDEDAAFGLGFVHAQDRLFQMELMRRYAAGRLAEIFGAGALPVDKQMRVLGLYRAAEAEIPFLSPEVNRALAAYAAGVNAFLATRHGALPPEFLLLRFSPEPWQEADSLSWGKLMALQIEGNYRGELLRADMARTISPADLAFLYPEYPKDAPTTLAAMLPIYRRLGLGRLYDRAAAGGRAALRLEQLGRRRQAQQERQAAPRQRPAPRSSARPAPWYLARLKTPGREIAGATAAGVPLVVIGHNDHIAWGFTTTTADVEDLFVEKVDPADPGRYLTPDGSAPFVTRHEKILVRGAPRSTSPCARPGTARYCRTRCRRARPIPAMCWRCRRPFSTPEDRSAEALWGATAPPTGRAFARLARFCRADAKHRLRRRRRHDRLYRAGAGADPQEGRRLDAGAGLDRRI